MKKRKNIIIKRKKRKLGNGGFMGLDMTQETTEEMFERLDKERGEQLDLNETEFTRNKNDNNFVNGINEYNNELANLDNKDERDLTIAKHNRREIISAGEMGTEGYQSAAPTAIKGVTTGFAVGGVVGGAVGGLIGLGVGLGNYHSKAEKMYDTRKSYAKDVEASQIAEKKIRDDKRDTFQKKSYANLLDDTNTDGNTSVNYFAEKGGSLKSTNIQAVGGGSLQPLASGIDEVRGATHKQGGVDLAVSDIENVEVENKEIIKDDDMVYSHKLGYAKEAKKLAKKKAKFEADLNSNDTHKKNTAVRMTQAIDKEMGLLFNHQEVNKDEDTTNNSKAFGGPIHNGKLITANPKKFDWDTSIDIDFKGLGLGKKQDSEYADFEFKGVDVEEKNYELEQIESKYDMDFDRDFDSNQYKRKVKSSTKEKMTFGDGGNIAEVAGYAIPLMENLYNRKLINNTPELTRRKALNPELQIAEELETEYDINPQLNEVDSKTKNFYANIDNTTNSSNVGRANKLMAHIQGIKQGNSLRGQKRNMETQLRNQNKLNRQGIDTKNIVSKNNYAQYNADVEHKDNMLEFRRKDEISGRKSENMANLSEDLQHGLTSKNQRNLDNRKMDLNMMKYNTGVQSNMLSDEAFVNRLKNDKNARANFKDMIKNNPNAIEKYNKLFPNDMFFANILKNKYRNDVRGVKRKGIKPLSVSESVSELSTPADIYNMGVDFNAM